MARVMRKDIADYMNTSTTSTAVWSLMGIGFTTLDENPNAQKETKCYINESNSSDTITKYQTQFPFTTDFISGDAAIDKIIDIARNHKVGTAAEVEYLRVDLYGTATSGAYPARKFKVAVEVSSITGEAGNSATVSGNLNAVGDFTEGTFNPTTGTFTASNSSTGGGA